MRGQLTGFLLLCEFDSGTVGEDDFIISTDSLAVDISSVRAAVFEVDNVLIIVVL